MLLNSPSASLSFDWLLHTKASWPSSRVNDCPAIPLVRPTQEAPPLTQPAATWFRPRAALFEGTFVMSEILSPLWLSTKATLHASPKQATGLIDNFRFRIYPALEKLRPGPGRAVALPVSVLSVCPLGALEEVMVATHILVQFGAVSPVSVSADASSELMFLSQ